MYISRVVIRNFRNISHLDVSLDPHVCTILGENNTGKTNFIHAIRLVLDANFSSQYRQLIEHDINSSIDIKTPQQVIVSVEFRDYVSKDNEHALVGIWEVEENLARLSYRFKPRNKIEEAIKNEEFVADNLSLEDYHWVITGGGENDPALVGWDENLGNTVRFSDLQHFQVVFLQALRDVRNDLRNNRISPLRKILDALEIPEEQKEELVATLREANDKISSNQIISGVGSSIQKSFSTTAGKAFDMAIRIGVADPSFASMARSLTLLLSNESLTDFDPVRNGLGLNNILYISMLMKYFENRVKHIKTAGQLLIIEEPEAHLHPQLQRILYATLENKPFQAIITTHSTHISSLAPLNSIIALTKKDGKETTASVLCSKKRFQNREIQDLERYLDATRSTLLYARKVILVEGPAELFLIPALVKSVMKIDLDTLGISVIPIYGVHFHVYSKLFSSSDLPKKCVIIADGDQKPSDSSDVDLGEEGLPELPRLDSLKNKYVNVFYCNTTFEKALTIEGLLPVLRKATKECGAKRITQEITNGYSELRKNHITERRKTEILDHLAEKILNTAKRFGKARFSQITSKYVSLAEDIPTYIQEAIEWLVRE